jgi:hypothetical protein
VGGDIELFGKLWIGSHPTPLQGEFQVLTLDFSQVGGDIEHLEENFNSYCGFCFDSFMRRYKEYYGEKVAEQVYAETQSHNKLSIIQKNAARRE